MSFLKTQEQKTLLNSHCHIGKKSNNYIVWYRARKNAISKKEDVSLARDQYESVGSLQS